jgi:phosphoglycerate dehydrogenase-like enzyme
MNFHFTLSDSKVGVIGTGKTKKYLPKKLQVFGVKASAFISFLKEE